MRAHFKEATVVMLLEAAQNLPLIAGFIAAYSFWWRNLPLAIGCALAGSTLSALAMVPTEGRIFEGHRESPRAILANVVVFSILMVAFAAYVHARWSSYWTDVAGGLVAGAALGVAQDLAAGERVGVTRVLALSVSCIVSLLLVRFAVSAWSPLVSLAVVTTWFTLVMGGYKLWRRQHPAAA